MTFYVFVVTVNWQMLSNSWMDTRQSHAEFKEGGVLQFDTHAYGFRNVCVCVCVYAYIYIWILRCWLWLDDMKDNMCPWQAELAIAGVGSDAAVSTVAATFALVFVAEWGDKSFFSTIGMLHFTPFFPVVSCIYCHFVSCVCLCQQFLKQQWPIFAAK